MAAPPTTKHRFRNWARTAGCAPSHYHQPRTEEEIVAVVRAAAAAGERVKLVGGGHSWNDIACTDAHLINLDRFREVVGFDVSKKQVTVQAGIRIKQLHKLLEERDLAMSSLGSIAEQSIAGAIATGTHGSGARYGSLSTQVVALRLVTASGDVLELNEGADAEKFAAARVHLGCLGVVTQVTLQCEPAFRLAEEAYSLPFEEALKQMDVLVESHQHVKLWWLPHTKTVQVITADRTFRDAKPQNAIARWLDDSFLVRGFFAFLLMMGSWFPFLIPAFNRLVNAIYLVRRQRVEKSIRIFNLPMPPRHRETEYAIPRARAAEALGRLRDVIEREKLRVNFIVEVRFAAADEILLSPAYKRESCHFGAYMYETRSIDRYFGLFEELMLQMEGRPHWGKEFTIGSDKLRKAHPAFERFEAVRRELDPGGMFVNGYVRRVFGLAAEEKKKSQGVLEGKKEVLALPPGPTKSTPTAEGE